MPDWVPGRWGPAQFIGGALCLDFANTVGGELKARTDNRLQRYADLVSWGLYAGALDAPIADALSRRDGRDPAGAAAALEQAVALRDGLYRIFSPIAAGAAADPADLERLNGAFAEAMAHLAVTPRRLSYGWRWSGMAEDLASPLWPIARSAAELLTGPELDRVRECGRCSWLFLDTSKNRRRRWCRMEVCGNRAKSARHYSRKRGVRAD